MTAVSTTSDPARIKHPARDFRRRAMMLHLDQLYFHPRNIRQAYTDLDELAASIANEGVLEPLLAHERWEIQSGETYKVELLAGHRRMLAAEIAGLQRVPVTVRERVDDDEAMFLFLGEDQKKPLNDQERRDAIVALHHEFIYDLPEIAARLGCNLATVRALYDGHDVAPTRTKSWPPPGARGRAPRRSVPKIRPTQVHQLVARWDSGQASGAEVITELRSMLGDWTPTTTADADTPSTTSDQAPADHAAETGDDEDKQGQEVSGDAVL